MTDQLPEITPYPLPALPSAPMRMLELAIERGATIEVLERLLTLQERFEATEARKAYVAALAAFKKDPPSLTKNKRTDFTSKRTGDRTEYDYLTLDEACEVIGPALSKHGLSHRWEVTQRDGMITVSCILQHAEGHSESVTLQAGADMTGNKNPIQGVGSTVTYLERYTLLAITGLAAKGQDVDANFTSSQPLSEDELMELQKLAGDTGADEKRFFAHIGVSSWQGITKAGFENAKQALEMKRKKTKEPAK